MITPQEKDSARPANFSKARRSPQRIWMGDGLVFDFEKQEVCGRPFASLTRFEIEVDESEGDDKTHYFFYLVLGDGHHCQVFSERGIVRVWSPIPGEVFSAEQIRSNLGALAYLMRPFVASLQSAVPVVDSSRAFWHAEAPGSEKSADSHDGLIAAVGVVVAACLWGLVRRLLFQGVASRHPGDEALIPGCPRC